MATGQDTTRDAQFPGGLVAWKRYIENNHHTPVTGDSAIRASSLTVVVLFVVEKDGSVTGARVADAKKKDPALVAEAIKVVSNSPKWLPALKKGKPVRSYMKQSVIIDISGE